MIRLEDRQVIAQAVEQAHQAGSRLRPACELAGIKVRTLQRWKAADGLVRGDRRPEAVRTRPAHALSDAERVDLHARLIQCFAHLYRIADRGHDQNNPVTLALAVVLMGQFSMPIPGQFSVRINILGLFGLS